jgi:hypothetical protein
VEDSCSPRKARDLQGELLCAFSFLAKLKKTRLASSFFAKQKKKKRRRREKGK